MAKSCQITINGAAFTARRGQLVLDAALENGVELPHECRAGHCGTCCVRLLSGRVEGGNGREPGIVHACQCRVSGDAVFERDQPSAARKIKGVVSSIRLLSSDIVEVAINVHRTLPYLAGQYATVRFDGYPSRPFSLTHPIEGHPGSRSVWFHIRRMAGGRVTPAIGDRIRAGHKVEITGPFGSAFFRPNIEGRLILVATNTGFAPIWSIAVGALRENPYCVIIIIVGARTIESLYMAPAISQLSRFPNVGIVPVCSTPQTASPAIRMGRPTDYLPQLIPTDVVYACGAPGMVEAIQARATRAGAQCYADPFVSTSEPTSDDGVVARTRGWLSARSPSLNGRTVGIVPTRRRTAGPDQPMRREMGYSS